VSGKLSEQTIQAALQVIADELMRLHPEWEVRIHEPGESLPPGAVTLPAVREDDVEAVRGRTPRGRR
jgi:hypothetical protein